MSTFVTVVPPAPLPRYPCPYEHKGCSYKILYLDEDDHIDKCAFNDGSVDIDRFFKEQVRKRHENEAEYTAARLKRESRKERYDPSPYKNSYFDPVTGKPRTGATQSAGRSRPFSKLAVVLILMGLLAFAGIEGMKAYYSSPAWQKAQAPQAPVDAQKLKAQRKMDHDLWAAGMANRRDMQRRIPGVQLGPPPPEPPKP